MTEPGQNGNDNTNYLATMVTVVKTEKSEVKQFDIVS